MTQRLVGAQIDFNSTCLPLRPVLAAKAMQLTRSPADAQDLVQDTLLQAFLGWGGFVVEAGESAADRAAAWLHRIMLNKFIGDRRAESRRGQIYQENRAEILAATLPGSGHCIVPGREIGATPDVTADAEPPARMSRAMVRALEALDADARAVLWRADVIGEDYLEISRDLNVPIGTIKSRLHRARTRVAEMLTRDGDRAVLELHYSAITA